jgi:hypothetical protein
MDGSFFISVEYKGKEYEFETSVVSTGYTHKFHVIVNGIDVLFEPDEERKYRAVIDTENMSRIKENDLALIRLVGEQIDAARG